MRSIPSWTVRALPAAVLPLLLCPLLPVDRVPILVVLVCFGVPLAVVDLRCRRLPDVLTLPAYPVVAAVVVATGADVVRAAACALLCFGANLIVHRRHPDSLGGGDVKLSGWLGAALGTVGWQALPVAAALSSLVTLSLRLSPTQRGPTVAHGPGLVAGAWLAVAFVP
ncbi:A24 family peptidase [Saccharothrix violaceirubra]|uniref:Leader peptidase (Prepilin peptidase)/N-methyltransferase n=1 Tax=Saccharothrix violaceirubra TaxID=413306 RepID=A0A7W7T116_9PSEU|nr:A24 family peptidase [Saccharothrix violaceirubra]MBB4964585.1 leader peptidase (prepilin peptidase)/N-methyltransferase [Saccharothrix violaceirubra]